MLKGLDILLINDTETQMLAGNNNLVQAARAVLALGPQTLVVKHGEYGATLFQRRSFSRRQKRGAHLQGAGAAAGRSGRPHRRGRQLCRRLLRLPGFAAGTHAGRFRRAMFYGSVMGSFAVRALWHRAAAAAHAQGDRRRASTSSAS